MVTGLDNENLGVFGSLRETRMNGQAAVRNAPV
jgi:hypothetical protein